MSHCSLGALRIAPCFFTSLARLYLPPAAACSFAPARLGFKILDTKHKKGRIPFGTRLNFGRGRRLAVCCGYALHTYGSRPLLRNSTRFAALS